MLPPEAALSNVQKGAELDARTEHYKLIIMHVADQLTLDGLAGLTKQMLAERAALHPEQEQ